MSAERRLIETVRLVGAPSLLTSLTTAAGFASMSFVPIKSIAHMGVYSAFGVMAAFAMSLTLLMALLSFGRSEPVAASADSGGVGGNALWVDRLLVNERRRSTPSSKSDSCGSRVGLL